MYVYKVWFISDQASNITPLVKWVKAFSEAANMIEPKMSRINMGWKFKMADITGQSWTWDTIRKMSYTFISLIPLNHWKRDMARRPSTIYRFNVLTRKPYRKMNERFPPETIKLIESHYTWMIISCPPCKWLCSILSSLHIHHPRP